MDASLVAIRVSDPNDVDIQQRWSLWRSEGREFVAPSLIWYEVANVLHQAWRTGRLTPSTVGAVFDAALNMPIVVHASTDLHRRAVDFGQRHNLPATYDAHYLALADHLGIEFWTADRKLVNTVSAALPWVKYAKDPAVR